MGGMDGWMEGGSEGGRRRRGGSWGPAVPPALEWWIWGEKRAWRQGKRQSGHAVQPKTTGFSPKRAVPPRDLVSILFLQSQEQGAEQKQPQSLRGGPEATWGTPKAPGGSPSPFSRMSSAPSSHWSSSSYSSSTSAGGSGELSGAGGRLAAAPTAPSPPAAHRPRPG